VSYLSSGKVELGVSSSSNPAMERQGIWLPAFTQHGSDQVFSLDD
jgi:hypothetical protein